MNSGGNNIIQWIPDLATATAMVIKTPYGYWKLDDHGAGFHGIDGVIKNGLGADGRIYADSIATNSLTGTTITGGTINGGQINGVTIDSAAIRGSTSIQLMNGNNVSTSVASYGISTPSITVNHIDGVNSISTYNLNVEHNATINYLHIASGGNISSDGGGLYLQGPVYVDGRKI